MQSQASGEDAFRTANRWLLRAGSYCRVMNGECRAGKKWRHTKIIKKTVRPNKATVCSAGPGRQHIDRPRPSKMPRSAMGVRMHGWGPGPALGAHRHSGTDAGNSLGRPRPSECSSGARAESRGWRETPRPSHAFTNYSRRIDIDFQQVMRN